MFKTSFLNTLIFLIFSAIIGQLILGFIIAYMMKQKNQLVRSTVGLITLIGWIMPEVVVCILDAVIDRRAVAIDRPQQDVGQET